MQGSPAVVPQTLVGVALSCLHGLALLCIAQRCLELQGFVAHLYARAHIYQDTQSEKLNASLQAGSQTCVYTYVHEKCVRCSGKVLMCTGAMQHLLRCLACFGDILRLLPEGALVALDFIRLQSHHRHTERTCRLR